MSKTTSILIAALGGEGGGVLMNWIVAAGRAAGFKVQATSVPGVAQRTGSTSYYIEVSPDPGAVLSLVPLPGRVDVVVASELVEAARMMAAGFVSPDRTTLIASTSRFLATSEKIAMGDGRYDSDSILDTANALAKDARLLDLNVMATQNGTFVSATLFGALAGSGALPWDISHTRAVLDDDRSRAGFDAAAAAALQAERPASEQTGPEQTAPLAARVDGFDHLPEAMRDVLAHGHARAVDFLDAAYGDLFLFRAQSLIDAADLADHRMQHALTEACRRLALWMAYEDIARVADLKTRPERFAAVREEVQLQPGQTLTITEYMKPRAEEIADILPKALGKRMMARVRRGGRFPLLGRGIYVRSNGVVGYRLLRIVAALKHTRRRSYRFAEEQSAIEDWLERVRQALRGSPDFAMGLAELPRVLKGYSDTLRRGKTAYDAITAKVVVPAIAAGDTEAKARLLRDAIGAALADENHDKLTAVLDGTPQAVPVPNLKNAAPA